MSGPRIMVIGSSNTDLTVLADSLPVPGETVLGGELVRAGGGKGANQAVAAARAGAEVAFVGRVGNDDFGCTALANLRQEGINTDHVAVDERAASGVALIIVGRKGENLIAVAPGANACVSRQDVQAARQEIAAADLVLLQLEIPLDTVRAAVELARSEGVPVLLDPAPAPPGRAGRELVKGLDYLTPNRGEAAQLLGLPPGQPPAALARELTSAGAGTVFLTLGAEGVCVCDGRECSFIKPPPVQAVDTVGAGDCFAGALAVRLAEGATLHEAARFAVCAAALSVQKAGAQPSLPRRADIENLLHEHKDE